MLLLSWLFYTVEPHANEPFYWAFCNTDNSLESINTLFLKVYEVWEHKLRKPL